jgi:D-amino-acid dehydrogenase
MMAKGIKWMFNSSSPFYLKPRLDMDFIKWAWFFNKSSTKAHVNKAIPLIKDINLLSKDLYTEMHNSGELVNFQLEKKGLLMLYKSKKEGAHEREVAKRAKEEGLEVRSLNLSELNSLQPNLSDEIAGAVHYQCDAHTSPNEIMENLKSYLVARGVQIHTRQDVVEFRTGGKKITGLNTQNTSFECDELILASGAWTPQLAKKLGLQLYIQAGKGYRINVSRPTGIKYPAVLMDAKVAVTPMNQFTRFAGTMEFSGINHNIRKERVRAIAKAAEHYYNELVISNDEILDAKCGLRPVSPDGLPFIGRVSTLKNLTIATGHAMMGWSLGPATGKLVSEILTDRKTSMPLDGFHPQRRF